MWNIRISLVFLGATYNDAEAEAIVQCRKKGNLRNAVVVVDIGFKANYLTGDQVLEILGMKVSGLSGALLSRSIGRSKKIVNNF